MNGHGLWRDADAHDEAFMAKVWAETFGAQFDALPPELAAMLCAQQYEAQLTHYRRSSPAMTTHVLRWEGFDVGRLLLLEGASEIRVLDIGVLPSHQGRGVGRAVMQRVLDLAGDRLVGLAVEKNRPVAHRLYVQLGFEAREETETHVFMEWRRRSP